MFEQSDEQLIKKALSGNDNAWLKIVKRYEKAVYNYGIRMTGNTEDALDLMQEVFISVYRNLATFRSEGSFKGWLFRIASYRCVEFYRKKKPTQGLDDAPEQVCEEPLPEQMLLMNQSNKQLIGALQQLPLAQRAVLELKFFGQFTFDEIAQQLDVPSNTVKSRLYSALEKLKQILEIDHAEAR
ncbi:sigma-70 family RNA polymerase sigma factor [Paraneptunicella aestuarii]|uniref:RNA polymerase sigma factor n=1 Tax=Paraneptunicella aestuarii TaxID=2831148 RepID=UPI001E31A6CA|nr:sigma-70 family RNA polymerase sigma factor [Paraneptunicella aestuarii]UAA37977.1 sigma-70 family RNA polymerase sigma factor [Paraneptunicella aestuarii]